MDPKDYSAFVNSTISEPSTNLNILTVRLKELENDGMDVPRLLTGVMGLVAEAAELADIVKKIVFQGKPYDTATHLKLLKEIGDVLWYFDVILQALGTNIHEVREGNMNKLKARYPEGFEVDKSENRKEGDI
tara:strand:- start:173 stop:568 length:396 start_codon:yes stop_codon:yes gene_type:complete